MSRGMKWTDAQFEELRALNLQGNSASQCAAELSARWKREITRNAVIGKLCRNNLSQRAEGTSATHFWTEEEVRRLCVLHRQKLIDIEIANALNLPYRAVRSKRGKLGLKANRHRYLFNSVPRKPRQPVIPPTPITDSNIPLAQRKSLMKLENCHCRWPVGDPDQPDFFFCGGLADLAANRSYCAAHTLRATNRLYRPSFNNFKVKGPDASHPTEPVSVCVKRDATCADSPTALAAAK